MKKLRAAVVGIGNMGRFHAKNYSEITGVELVALADLEKKKARVLALDLKCSFYEDYKKMISKEDLDIVSVAVPTAQHAKIAIDFIKAGINVLVEKPIADSVANAKKMITAADNSNVKLTVGHVERFNPAVLKLKEIIDSGKLGEISSIIARRVGIFPPQIKDADVVIDLAVHDIDIINFLLGKLPSSVFANGGKAIISNRNDYADILMKYGRASAIVQVNWITPVKIRKMNVTGSKGYAEMDYLAQEISLFESKYDKIANDFNDFVVKFGSSKKISVPVEKEQPLRRELLSFIESVKDNKKVKVTTQEALDALKIAMRIQKKIS